MTRCKPLLGTFVEISIHSIHHTQANTTDKAFAAIKKVQDLMGFHQPQSELCKINTLSHLHSIEIHPWTAQVLRTAREVYDQSSGLFNCGVGHRLVAAGLLPGNLDLSPFKFGGIEDLVFIDTNIIFSHKPLCLDLGGIAKGFAVDIAVDSLLADGIESGCVNAGGDLRVFGNEAKSIHIRNPAFPSELVDLGKLRNGSIATSSLYFSKRENHLVSHIVNPLNQAQHDFSESFSIIAEKCIHADALTKVLALSNQLDHPCFPYFSAQAIRIAA
jgi:FAD:protein FMN transferase